MKPTYFDFTVANATEAKRFFEHVLGWRFERFPMPYEYYRITARAVMSLALMGAWAIFKMLHRRRQAADSGHRTGAQSRRGPSKGQGERWKHRRTKDGHSRRRLVRYMR